MSCAIGVRSQVSYPRNYWSWLQLQGTFCQSVVLGAMWLLGQNWFPSVCLEHGQSKRSFSLQNSFTHAFHINKLRRNYKSLRSCSCPCSVSEGLCILKSNFQQCVHKVCPWWSTCDLDHSNASGFFSNQVLGSQSPASLTWVIRLSQLPPEESKIIIILFTFSIFGFSVPSLFFSWEGSGTFPTSLF